MTMSERKTILYLKILLCLSSYDFVRAYNLMLNELATQYICFSLVNGATLLFPGGRALKLVRTGVKISNSTNLLSLTKKITLTLIDYCSSPLL